jgi:hypothetical protein
MVDVAYTANVLDFVTESIEQKQVFVSNARYSYLALRTSVNHFDNESFEINQREQIKVTNNTSDNQHLVNTARHIIK